jgi:hypothetical protein
VQQFLCIKDGICVSGIIEAWDNKKIKTDRWMRFAIRPTDRVSGRAIMTRFREWFVEEGLGRCMIHVVDHSRYCTVAFSENRDSVLFRLFFSDISIGFVPQPHSHERYDHQGT